MIRANFHFAETSKVLWCTCTLVLLLALVFPKPTSAQTDNTAYGTGALGSNTTGDYNSAFGFDALYTNNGGYNTATGYLALFTNTTGSDNTAVGGKALYNNTSSGSTAVGYGALYSNTTGVDNTAVGFKALLASSTGGGNTAVGYQSLYSSTDAVDNTALGNFALYSDVSGSSNTAVGYSALLNNETGSFNVTVGGSTGNYVTGNYNILLGYAAGYELTSGSNNIEIGNQGAAGDNAAIRIGTQGTQTASYIAGIYGATAPGGVEVFVNSAGQLGVQVSSARFKEAIQPMDDASEAILALKPVTFRYKKDLDPQGIPQFGLVAEQVERVDPNLVVRDAKGQVLTVRYEAVNAMLLNEFLKEHQRVQELQMRMDAMAAQMKEQARLIEEVRDKVEINNSSRQLASNTQ
ncbi:MAG: tail fiber domain-containing protein [Terriglobales bacterium]